MDEFRSLKDFVGSPKGLGIQVTDRARVTAKRERDGHQVDISLLDEVDQVEFRSKDSDRVLLELLDAMGKQSELPPSQWFKNDKRLYWSAIVDWPR